MTAWCENRSFSARAERCDRSGLPGLSGQALAQRADLVLLCLVAPSLLG